MITAKESYNLSPLEDEFDIVPLEFEFIDGDGRVTFELDEAEWLGAEFECPYCKTMLFFKKKYHPVPLHHESLIAICKEVKCYKCHLEIRHCRDEEGEDIAVPWQIGPDPNQLSLFT